MTTLNTLEYLLEGDLESYHRIVPKLTPEEVQKEKDRADYKKACEILKKKELDDKRIMESNIQPFRVF